MTIESKVYLYFTTTKWSLASIPIRWSTRSPISHVGFAKFPSSKLVSTQFFSAQLNGGVQTRFHRRCTHSMYEESFDYITYRTAPRIEEAYQWALTQVGKPYDWRAILGMAADRNWREDDAWFCSELVAMAFEQAGSPLFNPDMQVWRVTPRDVLMSLLVYPCGVGDLPVG